MAPEKSKSEQLEKKVREIAPDKADKVLTRYQKVQEGLHDALFGETVDEKYAAAQAGMDRLAEMEDEILAKGEDVGKGGERGTSEQKEQREALVADFDAELGSIADSLGIGLQVAEAHDALAKERAEKDAKYYFGQIDAILGDFFGKSVVSEPRFVQAYVNRGERPRADIKSIAANFCDVLPYFHEASETARKIIVDSRSALIKALMLFINGRASEGNKILWGVKTKIDGAKVVEAEILPKLRAEKEKIYPAQMKHSEACEAMRKLVEKDGGGDPIRKAEAQEKMLVTYLELLKSAEGFAKLRESFVIDGPNGEDFQEQREDIFIELVNEDLRSIKTISVKTVEKSRKVIETESLDETNFFQVPKEKTVKVPKLVARDRTLFLGNTKELQGEIENTDLELLSVRRDLFLMTGDEKYREAFEKGQEKINNGAKTAALKEVDATEDGEAETRAAVKKEIEMMSIQFAQIQKKQGEDPLEALQQNTFFLKGLYDLREELGAPVIGAQLRTDIPLLHPLRATDGLKGLSIGPESPFKNLQREAPELHAAFLSAIDRYIGMSYQMQVVDTFSKDRVFVKFMKDMTDFVKETHDFVNDFRDFMAAQERDDDSFSEERVNGIRNRIATFRLGTRVYNDVVTAKIFSRLREYEELIVGLVPGFEEEFKKLEDQMRKMNKVCAQICYVMNFLYDDARGYQEWSLDKLVNLLSKLAAGVIVAVLVVGALTLLGPIGAGLIGLMVTGAIAGGAGYMGYIAQSQLIDDRPDEFTPEGLLQATAFGALFGAAGRFVGQPFGRMLGRFAQNTNVRLASLTAPSWMGNGGKIFVDMLRKFGERGLNRQVQQLLGKFAQHGLAGELPKEFLQEVFDEILEHLGKVIAPHHPWVGFMFQVLASGMHHAKTVKIDAIFAINGDVTVAMTDSSVSFEFSDKARALDALRQHGAPAEVIAAFETNGFVNAARDGVTIIVRPSNEPVMVRQLLANQAGQNAALLAGLRFHEADPDTGLGEGYTFEGSPEALMTRLESEFFVEMTKEGDIIATDMNGNKVIFLFANKHLGLEVAGLLNSGLELDAQRRPTVTRAENVLPVLGKLSQMGFELEQSANGIVAKKKGQPDVEINLDQTVAAEVAEGGRSVLELAAALNEDTDGFGARMLAQLNGAKDKVSEALLWAGTKAQVEIQSLMGRIGRALEARANKSAAANLAVPGGLSLLTAGCSIEDFATNQFADHPIRTVVIGYLLLHGGAAAILQSLLPVAGKGAWWLVKAPFLLGKFAFSKSFRSEIDASQPGISVQPSRPTKAELDLGNLGDLSVESQTSFDAAFSQLKKVFAGLRFAVPTVSKPETLAKQDGTRETKTVLVPDTDAAKAKAQEMFNDIMRLIFLSLRKADIEAGRATAPQPQTTQGQPGFRQQRGAGVLPQKPTLSPNQELQDINQRLGTGIGELLTQNLTDIQTLSILASVRVDVKKNAMAMVDSFLTSKNIDPKSAEGLAIKAEINRIFKVLRDCKPDSTFRQLTLAEARRDAMLPSRERSAMRLLKLVVGSDKILQNEQIQASQKLKRLLRKGLKKLNAKEQAEFDKALSDLISFFKTAGLNSSEQVILAEIEADVARFDTIVAAHKALMKELGRIKSSVSPIWPESRRSRAIGATALVVALTTALGYAGAAMFGGDDEAAAAAGEGGGQPVEGGGGAADGAGAAREKAAQEDNAAVDVAAEGNSAAVKAALEYLKESYREKKTEFDAMDDDDPDKAVVKQEVERLAGQLRKNGVNPNDVLASLTDQKKGVEKISAPKEPTEEPSASEDEEDEPGFSSEVKGSENLPR